MLHSITTSLTSTTHNNICQTEPAGPLLMRAGQVAPPMGGDAINSTDAMTTKPPMRPMTTGGGYNHHN